MWLERLTRQFWGGIRFSQRLSLLGSRFGWLVSGISSSCSFNAGFPAFGFSVQSAEYPTSITPKRNIASRKLNSVVGLN